MINDQDIFKALIVRKHNSSFSYKIEEKKIQDLPKGELLIKVNYTNINFKDAMSCQGNPSITRRFPHTPGIDACGKVIHSSDPEFYPEDDVLIICRPMGLNTSGGFAEFIRIPSSWAIKIDKEIKKEYLMAFGTAGFTGIIAVNSIIKSFNNLPSKVIVSGATGGLALISILILKNLGIKVTALTRSKLFLNKLKLIGIDEIIHPDKLIEITKQNLALPKWDAAIDVLGGDILSALIKTVKPKGSISVTGNAQSTSLNTNVLPFILRGISLNGVNAEMLGKDEIYNLIDKAINKSLIPDLIKTYTLINFDELPKYIDSYLKGEVFGRVVVKIS